MIEWFGLEGQNMMAEQKGTTTSFNLLALPVGWDIFLLSFSAVVPTCPFSRIDHRTVMSLFLILVLCFCPCEFSYSYFFRFLFPCIPPVLIGSLLPFLPVPVCEAAAAAPHSTASSQLY